MEQTASTGTLHQAVLYLPVITTLISVFFCYTLFSRYRTKGGGLHLLWWGIGMTTYGIGTFTEAYTSIFGWNETVFRSWYIAGAFLGGYPLAQGSIYLLMSRRFAHRSAIIVTSLIAVASMFVILTPLDQSVVEMHRLSGNVIEWNWVRFISPFFNLYSVIFLVGGAVVSALRFRRAGRFRHRYIGNILIAMGAILPGIGGAMTRAGYVEVLYVTELIGLCLIYGGYRMNIREVTPAAAADSPLASRAAALLLAVLLLPGGLLADTPEEAAEATDAGVEEVAEDEADPIFYSTTTVTATGSRTESFNVAVPVTVLEELTVMAPNNAADLLRFEVGVDVNGVGPNQGRPIIRGQSGLRVLFLEDGLRMNNSRRQTDFGEIPGLVDLDSVEAIEIVRGPASVLYGTDAIGGVLNLITRAPTFADRMQGSLGLRAGTAGDPVRASAALSGGSERLAFQLGASYRDVSNYNAPSGSFGDIRFDSATEVVDSGVTDNSLWGRLDYRGGDRHIIFLRLNRYRADDAGFGFVEPDELEGADDFRIRILYPFQDFDKYTLGYQGSGLSNPLADTFEAQAYWQSNERQLVNDIDINIGPLFPGAPYSSVAADTENFTDLDTLGLRLQATRIAGDNNLITWGAEIWQDDSVNTDASEITTTLRFPFPPFEVPIVTTDEIANAPNAKHTSYGIFAQDEILWSDLTITLGARYQNVKTSARATPGWDITGLDFDDDSVVGAVSLLYHVSTHFNLTGSYGTAFRAPNIIERLFNGPTPEGAGFQLLNRDLISETSRNFDVGFKYQNRRSFLNLTYFQNVIDDGIVQYFLSPDEIAALPPELQEEIALTGVSFVVQQRNIARLEYEGLELIGGYRLASGLSFGGNYTHLDGKRVDSTNPPTGDTYSDKLNLHARYEQPAGRFWAEYRLRRNGDQRANLDPNEPVPPVGKILPAFTVHTISGGVNFEGGPLQHRVSLIIDNLSDELYAEFSNATFFRPQAERNYMLTYALRF